MDYFSLFGIAVGLAMDAFAVCVANGAAVRKIKIRFAAKLAVCFGLFQAAMPIIGWFIGKAGEGFIKAIDHWIALALLSYIGIDMIVQSYKKSLQTIDKKPKEDIQPKTLLTLAVATSIDALATGLILPPAVGASTVLNMIVSVTIIGLITCIICFAGVYIGKKFGTLCSSKAEIFGGIVLISIGVKIFIEHMFFGG